METDKADEEMEKKIDKNKWARREERLGTQKQSKPANASVRFQRMVDVAVYDGYISSSEAHMLVQEHNKMQDTSRKALLRLLKDHGYENLANRGVRRTELPLYGRAEVSNTDAQARTASPREWATFASELAYIDEDVDYVDYGKLVPKGQKARFFLIIVVPMIVVLLKLAGAF